MDESGQNYSSGKDLAPLYNRIRYFRQKRRLTLAQLAEAAGCDLAFLWRQEQQKVPTPDALKVQIARVLQQPITVLFFQDEPPQEAATPALGRTPPRGFRGCPPS